MLDCEENRQSRAISQSDARRVAHIGKLIVGERPILFEREKRANVQHERRHSAARTIKLNRHASLPA
jgi:hypothetical protein